MRFDVITLFPELIKNSFEHGITGRALSSKKILLDTVNPRDFSEDISNKVDDRPYGGGPGMVMQAEPMIAAIRKAKKKSGLKARFAEPIFNWGNCTRIIC